MACAGNRGARAVAHVHHAALDGRAYWQTSFERDGLAPPPFAVGRPAQADRVHWLATAIPAPWPHFGAPTAGALVGPGSPGASDPGGVGALAKGLGQRVKIYVTAGPLEAAQVNGLSYGPCQHLTQEGCSIYEIDWPIPAGTPPSMLRRRYMRKLVSGAVGAGVGPGNGKPEVHHLRPLLAYNFGDALAPPPNTSRIGIIDLMTGSPTAWDLPLLLGTAPAWGEDARLWFNRSQDPPEADGVTEDPRYQELWSAEMKHLGLAGSVPLSYEEPRHWFPRDRPVEQAGYCSFGWPSPNPVVHTQMAFQQVWAPPDMATEYWCPFLLEALSGGVSNRDIVQFPAVGTVIDLRSAATKFDGGDDPWTNYNDPGELAKEKTGSWWPVAFVRGWEHDQSRDQPHGLAHADFAPRGDVVAYFEQEGASYASESDLLGIDTEYARTYGFELAGATFSSVRRVAGSPDEPAPLYDHPAVADLPPPADAFAGQCVHYLHKYARFCGAPGDVRDVAGLPQTMLVVSVHCADNTGKGGELFGARRNLFGRVYLVDFTDAHNPVYEDLTSWVELFEDVGLGTYTGTFGGTQADCGPWYQEVAAGGPSPPGDVWPLPPAAASLPGDVAGFPDA